MKGARRRCFLARGASKPWERNGIAPAKGAATAALAKEKAGPCPFPFPKGQKVEGRAL